MHITCSRKDNGRFLVESEFGDRFEFLVATNRLGAAALRLSGPPHWRPGPWPSNAKAIESAARAAALARAVEDGILA